MAQEGLDIEAAQPAPTKHTKTAVLESAALLAIWSLLVINEGAIRVMDQNPSEDLFEAGRPSKFAPVLGGLLEIVFGLFGFFVGVSAFMLKRYSTFATKLCLVVQSILGYYVFAVFVFVLPIFRAVDLTEPSLVGLTISQSRVVIALGILTSFHFCLALQGGQFLFMARLICDATGENFMSQRTGNRMRAIFWNMNLALSGFWTFVTGAIINANVGSGRLETNFFSPPNVGVLPGLTIFTGLLMLVWGGVGVTFGIMGIAPVAYFIGTAAAYVIAMLNFGIVQLGLLEDGPAGAVAMHNGLVFMVFFLGSYFVYHTSEEMKKGPVS